ncbi:MAG: hypothetical protein WCI36_01615 [bacterium]
MFKKNLFLFLAVISLIFGGLFVGSYFVHAEKEDGKYERDGEGEDDDYKPATVSTPAATVQEATTSTPKPATYKQTVVVTPAQIVTEYQTETISLSDRDLDGIADVDDQYPDVADIYIVKDENGNGIVDTFEYAS